MTLIQTLGILSPVILSPAILYRLVKKKALTLPLFTFLKMEDTFQMMVRMILRKTS